MAARPILTFLATLTITAAHAAPRSDPSNGRAVFTGATVPSASAIRLNPAALGLGKVGELFVAITSLLDHHRIDRRDLDGQPTDVSVREVEPGFGGMVAAVLRAGERSTVGFEARVQPPERLGPEAKALRFQSAGGWQRDYVASISASFRIASGVYFGASLSHSHSRMAMRYSLDEAVRSGDVDGDCGGARCGFENPLATETYDVDVRSKLVSTSNLEVNIGVAIRLAEDMWLGVAYHTPPGFDIQSRLEGDMRVRRSTRDGGNVVEGGSSVYISYPASVDAELRARLPALLDLHVGGRWLDLSRFRAIDVRGHGSNFPTQQIPEWTMRARGLEDSFALWGGVEQVDIGQPARFGGRLGIESAAVDDRAISSHSVYPTSVTLDAGAQLRLAPSWTVQLSYGVQYFPSVTVTDSAFDPRHQLDCIASNFDYTTAACAAVRGGYATATANGDYARFTHALRLAFRYELP